MAASQARKSSARTTKSTKEVQTRAKRLMRDVLTFWKKNEREERDFRKRAEKEAVDRAKEEEEKREAARQARKLEFLISQTELHSHFVGNKLKSKLIHDIKSITADTYLCIASEAEKAPHDINVEESGLPSPPPGADIGDTSEPLDDLDFDNGKVFAWYA